MRGQDKRYGWASAIIAIIFSLLIPQRVLAIAENRAIFYPYYSDKVSLCEGTPPAGGAVALSQNIPQVWRDLIAGAAPKYPDVDPRLVAAVLWAENGKWPEYKKDGWAQSPAGATGPFQFIPSTWFGSGGWRNVTDESQYGPNALGTDGDGDGVRDPNNPRDAVEAAFKHHIGSAGKPIAIEGFTGKADEDFNTVVFQRNASNLLFYAAKYNGSGAPDGVKLKDFPRGENADYVLMAYWLLATDFTRGYMPASRQVVDALTNNRAGEAAAPGGSVAAADSSGECNAAPGGQLVGDVAWPVDKKFWESNPEWFTKPHHNQDPASDIQVSTGTPIYAMIGGTVKSTNVGGRCGEGVEIHTGNIQTLYCHGIAGRQIVNVGSQVNAGQHIMDSDSTGNVTGPHLHLQIRVNGTLRCPQEAFKALAQGIQPDINNLPNSGCTTP